MKFVVKFFSEITIKSRPVRKRLVAKLHYNLNAVVREYDPDVVIKHDWDKLQVHTELQDPQQIAAMVGAMRNVAGISYILEVAEFPLPELDNIVEYVLPIYAGRLKGKNFAVRCKRNGDHPFKSVEVERKVGGALLARTEAAGVKLKQPEVPVELEISRKTLFVIKERHRGLGGFPVGSTDPVISLISGGFDSPVATYLTMKRGMRSHFLFFNLGGRDHEIGVKEVALYLWQKFGCNQRVLFISVPFEEVVAELLTRVEDSQMGVILKRMMLRVANQIAEELEIDALVTGEAVAQVSSQTLRNLSVIDEVSERLVLRPLVATDKGDIVRTANDIGTGEFAASMPEYCGVISVNPTTRARLERVRAEEECFDMSILERAVTNASRTRIDRLAEEELERTEVEVLSVPLAESVIIDIRHPDEEELAPLAVHVPVEKIPFYELHSKGDSLHPDKTYMLYCGKGVMSRLHASHLVESGCLNVKVYAP
ncbi:tRNA 4-thiouridine(8) synthase ThiI [Halioglobus sp. HI00S01]|uniref:tRNA uracil 4-sulfurtransferase ThiI n=1 Tax=Halioglobus sp. HI00S01 TaxID=1822214 RepID=UPI0007C2F7CD|nr:tRNA uracil 4-sulfurtransferase ThiI [Halioglobus sp. HI00S01]KZX56060.1 tRNA 4-thiouridine(8) synthase ThiI [Halioglobus sp. HI00S01]